MSSDFYRAFEDKHRGSRELILSRLRVYLPFVEPLKAICPDCRAVDLGCGRGEWLELMGEVGIEAHGIDLDDGMLAACHERGLSVEQGDAIAYLRGLPDGSVAVVSAFHVVEHIPFDALQTLVQEALRVLVPAGLLILETPNPENLSVGACKFYYDPTHQRPIPPPLLSFLPEHFGFARTKVLRLQEAPGLAETSAVSLSEVLLGVSPDYAVVAQKGSEDQVALSRFDGAFAQEHGVDLDSLAMNYDRTVGDRLDEILARVDRSAESAARQALEVAGQAQALAEQAEARARQAEGREGEVKVQLEQALAVARRAQSDAEAVRQELHHVRQSSRHHWQLAEERGQQVQALLSSTSWRVTAPVRWVATSFRSLGRLPGRVVLRLKIWLKPHAVRAVTHPASKRLIERTGRWVIDHPNLSDPIRALLRRHERLRNRLRWLVLGQHPPRPFDPRTPVPPTGRKNAERRKRQPLTGAASDIDELMLRIEDELVRWSSTPR